MSDLQVVDSVRQALTEKYGEQLAEKQLKIETLGRDRAMAQKITQIFGDYAKGRVRKSKLKQELMDRLYQATYLQFTNDWERWNNDNLIKALLPEIPVSHILERGIAVTLDEIFKLAVPLEESQTKRGRKTRAHVSIATAIGRGILEEARAFELGMLLERSLTAKKRNKIIALGSNSKILNHLEWKVTYRKSEVKLHNILPKDSVKLGAYFLKLVLDEEEMCEFISFENRKGGDPQSIALKPEWLDKIQKGVFGEADAETGYLPMVVPPCKWISNDVGGYYLNHRPLVQNHKRRKEIDYIVDRGVGEDVLKALNLTQETPFEVNEFMYNLNKELFENVNNEKSSITCKISKWPSDVVLEYPKAPDVTGLTKEQAKIVKKRYKGQVNKVEKTNQKNISKRSAMSEGLFVTSLYRGGKLYFPHYLDFRSRQYPTPPSLNQQKDDFLKSMLLCSEALPVGERGWYWLKSTCATLAGFKVNGKGLDKIHPDERVKWVDGNIQFICEIANNPEEYVENWGNADKPFQFLACCREIAKAVEFGNPHEYVCGFPIQFDGSCSGIQHYSAMFLDENGGKMVNLSDDKEMADVYRAVAEIVVETLNTHLNTRLDTKGKDSLDRDAINAIKAEEKKGKKLNWIPEYVKASNILKEISKLLDRSMFKNGVMTYPYSATVIGAGDTLCEYIEEKLKDVRDENSEWAILREATLHTFYLAQVARNATEELVVKAAEGMHYFQCVAEALAKKGVPMVWDTPDGFPAIQSTVTQKSTAPLCFMPQSVHAKDNLMGLSCKTPTDKLDSRKQKSGIAPNLIHSQDATHLRMAILACAKRGVRHFVMIHDSFGTIPAHAQIMYEEVRNTFIELYTNPEFDLPSKIDKLAKENLPESVYNKLPKVPSKGNLNLNKVSESVFAFL